jgi:hypothetical protein
MAKVEYHGRTPEEGGWKSGHGHTRIYPADWTWDNHTGKVSQDGLGLILTLDGQEGHWHIDVRDEVGSILEGLTKRLEPTT